MRRFTLLLAFTSIAVLMRASEPPASTDWAGPRTPDGQPAIAGFFNAVIGGTYSLDNPRRGGGRLQELLAQARNMPLPKKASRIVDPPDGEVPYQPWARAKQQDLLAHIDAPIKPEYIDPQERCLPDGPIRSTFWSDFEIQQFPGYVILIYDQNHPYRVITLNDAKPHPNQSIKLYMGDSRGHWEGNTLVVDVANDNSKSRLSNEGDFASDNLHITERYIFADRNHVIYEAVMTDQTVYTRPWTIRADLKRAHNKEPNYEQWENTCHEGERDSELTLQGAIVGGGK